MQQQGGESAAQVYYTVLLASAVCTTTAGFSLLRAKDLYVSKVEAGNVYHR